MLLSSYHSLLLLCFCFLSAPDTTPLRVTATMNLNLTTIKVTWVHPAKGFLGGNLQGYYIKYQAVRQGGEPIPESELKPASKAIACANHSEIILGNLSLYTTYKIEVAPITADGEGTHSEPVYGGIK